MPASIETSLKLVVCLVLGRRGPQEKRAAFARQLAAQRAKAEEARAAWERERTALEAETASLQACCNPPPHLLLHFHLF